MIACAAPFHILDVWPILTAVPAAVLCLRLRIMATLKKSLLLTLALTITPLPGCASKARAWKTTYVVAATTSQLVTDTMRDFWQAPLAERLIACEPAAHPNITTRAEYDACLGVFANNDKVLAALSGYNASMHAMQKALLATNPEGASPEDRALLRRAGNDLVAAATNLLSLLPKGSEHAETLQRLTNR